MTAISELVVLVLSLGALNSWQDERYSRREIDPADSDSSTETQMESRSLYDLMAHFPLAKDVTCLESDSRLRYPGECTRYITCRNYQPHVRSCPPGMSFDQDSKQCRLAFEVDCREEVETMETCTDDEEFLQCGCDKTCDSTGEVAECAENCEGGCFCRPGLFRDSHGNCVPPDACQSENSLFSVFKSL